MSPTVVENPDYSKNIAIQPTHAHVHARAHVRAFALVFVPRSSSAVGADSAANIWAGPIMYPKMHVKY